MTWPTKYKEVKTFVDNKTMTNEFYDQLKYEHEKLKIRYREELEHANAQILKQAKTIIYLDLQIKVILNQRDDFINEEFSSKKVKDRIKTELNDKLTEWQNGYERLKNG